MRMPEWVRRQTIAVLVALAAVALSTIACNLSFSVPAGTGLNGQGGRAPVVFLVPEPNSQIAEGATIQLAVRAEDPVGVARIDFTADDQAIGSQLAPAEKLTSFTALQVWVANGVRGHLLSATAYRADNTPIGSADLTVNVLPLPGLVPMTPGGPAALTSAPPALPPVTVTLPAFAIPTMTPSIPIAPSVTPIAPVLPTQAVVPTIAAPTIGVPTLPAQPTIAGGSNDAPQALITTAFLNVRAGPGPTFQTLGQVKAGDVVNILARNADRTWWAIQAPSGLRGWILNNPAYIQVTGNTETVPLGAAQPTPTP